jgi:hypothetical protein
VYSPAVKPGPDDSITGKGRSESRLEKLPVQNPAQPSQNPAPKKMTDNLNGKELKTLCFKPGKFCFFGSIWPSGNHCRSVLLDAKIRLEKYSLCR